MVVEDSGIRAVIERHRRRLLEIAGVVGVGAGMSAAEPRRPCIHVFADLDEWPPDLPRELDGFPVELCRTSGFTRR